MLTTSLRHELFRVSRSSLQLACDCRVRHEECRGHLKHVLKPYDNRSHRQFDIVEIVYYIFMTRAVHAIRIACHNRKQKSYCVNRLYRSKVVLTSPGAEDNTYLDKQS